MVLPGSSIPSPTSTPATTSPKRFNGPYNFTLKWGSRRLLRCTTNAVTAANAASGSRDRRRLPVSTVTRKRKRKKMEPERNESCSLTIPASPIHDLEETREKLMHDLRTSVDRMRSTILERDEERPEESLPAAAAVVRPWNIVRIRLSAAASKTPADVEGSGNGLTIDEKKHNVSPSLPARAEVAAVSRSSSGEAEKVKFCVSLSKEEIEEDFMKMMGRRPPRRPKKRPKAVQKELDTLLPCLSFAEITADTYKVPESPLRRCKKSIAKDASLRV